MATTQDAQKQRFYAGLFRRLGWDEKGIHQPCGSRNRASLGWLGGVVARGAFTSR